MESCQFEDSEEFSIFQYVNIEGSERGTLGGWANSTICTHLLAQGLILYISFSHTDEAEPVPLIFFFSAAQCRTQAVHITVDKAAEAGD